jgi:hypothetical protein
LKRIGLLAIALLLFAATGCGGPGSSSDGFRFIIEDKDGFFDCNIIPDKDMAQAQATGRRNGGTWPGFSRKMMMAEYRAFMASLRENGLSGNDVTFVHEGRLYHVRRTRDTSPHAPKGTLDERKAAARIGSAAEQKLVNYLMGSSVGIMVKSWEDFPG